MTYNQSQTKLNRKQRRQNIKNAFAIRADAVLNPNLCYVIVDDVYYWSHPKRVCCGSAHRRRSENKNIYTWTWINNFNILNLWPFLENHNTPQYPLKKDIPKDLWTKCPKTGEIIYNRVLKENLMVVPSSGYHFPLKARERIEALLDVDSFVEMDAEVSSLDPLHFNATASYTEKLKANQKKPKKSTPLCPGLEKWAVYRSVLQSWTSDSWPPVWAPPPEKK